MIRARSILFASIALASACGGENPPPVVHPAPPPPASVATAPTAMPGVTPDAPFRQSAPPPDGTVKFVPPKIEEAKLKNGLRVLVVERHELPVVTVRVLLTVGAGDVPEARAGTISFLGSMLEQGTKKRSALEIDDDFEAIGAQHATWFDWDSGGAWMKVLADRLDAGLDLLSDVVLSPSFPQAEIDRLKARRIASIQAEKSNPRAAAQNTIAAALFGRAHPYGHTLTGEEADAKKLTRAEIVGAYDRIFSPQNAAIVVAGDVTPSTLVPKLEARFGAWKARPGAVTRHAPKTPASAAAKHRVVFVDRPGAQSQIEIIKIGVPYARKDREAIVVTNAILGGMFSSRINLNLREKNAYTYGARSYFAMRHGAGPFLVAAPVFADKTGAAVKEALSEIEGLRKEGPTPEELALAKESLKLAMPGRFETTNEVASAVAELVVYDLPLDDYDKRIGRIDAVTAADVRKVADELLATNTMTLVVVGNKQTVLPQLEPLNLGEIEERDPYGNPIAASKAEPKSEPKK